MTATSKPWLAAAIAWTVGILAVNSMSVPHTTWRPPFAGIDKLTHAALYAVAAYAWRRAIRSPSDAVGWWVVVSIGLVGAFDEWHQQSVPGRSAEALDWLADVIGGFLGVLAARRLHAPRETQS